MTEQLIRIVVADDHTIFRDGLKNLLEADRRFRVVGEACDGEEAVNLVTRLKPDILLLDLVMPRVSGMEALRRIVAAAVPTGVIMVVDAVERDDVLEVFRLGGRGYVSKESATAALFAGICAVAAGQYWMGREPFADLEKAIATLTRSAVKDERPKDFGLTPRELEIVSAVVTGHSNREIARKLSISEQTVKHHLTNIFDKAGVFNRLELALFAINHHLVRG